MSSVLLLLLLTALVGTLTLAVGAFVVVRGCRRVVTSTRAAVDRRTAPARTRVLAVQALVGGPAAARHAVARDVLAARRAWTVAAREGRPVGELEQPLLRLEQAARSLDLDLRLRPAADQAADVAELRRVAGQLRDAVAVAGAPAARADRARLLEDVRAEAERVQLAARAHAELAGS
jgi:hypothetical protein